jgi:hypothetical protein
MLNFSIRITYRISFQKVDINKTLVHKKNTNHLVTFYKLWITTISLGQSWFATACGWPQHYNSQLFEHMLHRQNTSCFLATKNTCVVDDISTKTVSQHSMHFHNTRTQRALIFTHMHNRHDMLKLYHQEMSAW